MTKDNSPLGKFELSGIPPAPRGVPKVEVTFDIDANGILNVTAKDESTGKSSQIQIKNEKGRLSQAEIDKMVADAEKYQDDDNKQKERVTARNGLEQYVFQYKQAANEANDTKLSQTDKELVINKCDETMKWLDNNTLAEKEEYDHQLQALHKVCSPMMSKLHGSQPNSSHSEPSGHAQQGPTVEEMD